ncbi:hypothetical protein [Shewanella baltica]|uniref:hypothetical protein n=1 Tax=Shewanella baltica TaxID=62322 RepID=UPI000D34F9CE|nr:hypothetical protein [Shewanella baltica]
MVYLNKYNEVVFNKVNRVEKSNLSISLINELNANASSLKGISIFCNELYLFFYIVMKEWEVELKRFKKGEVRVFSKSRYSCLWLLLLKNMYGFKFSYYMQIVFFSLPIFVLCIVFFASSIVTIPLFLFAKWMSTKKNDIKSSRKLCIVRSQAAFDKIYSYSVKESVDLISEDIFYKNSNLPSIFSYLNLSNIIDICFSYPKVLIKDSKELFFDVIDLFSINCLGFVFLYYLIRLPFTSLSRLLYVNVFHNLNVSDVVTGNKEDRFALIESELSQKHGIKLICLPHGLEYSFKLPRELVGDLFYATSEHASIYLNRLYGTAKFVYDSIVINDMFDKKYILPHKKCIVFFTEARELNVNLEIIRMLDGLRYDFSVKLHPKDCKSNYSLLSFPIDFIDDFKQAVTGNYCLARKSTILLEAIYNGSISSAVLINSKDSYYVDCVFPSLSDPLIRKFYCFSELDNLLMTEGFKKNV